MVKEVIKDSKKYYICEECSLAYVEKEWAQKCEDWCAKNKSCNLEITHHAINPNQNYERT